MYTCQALLLLAYLPKTFLIELLPWLFNNKVYVFFTKKKVDYCKVVNLW